LVATQAGVVSMGSRRTRREHRARKKRAQLKTSLSTTPRKSVFIVLSLLAAAVEALGRGVSRGLLWGLIVLIALLLFAAEKGRLLLAGSGRGVLGRTVRVADKGFGRDPLLCVGLLGCGLTAMTYVLAGKTFLAVLFCLLAVLVGVGLLIRQGGEGA
jgi:hypothetical protein